MLFGRLEEKEEVCRRLSVLGAGKLLGRGML